MSSEHIDVIGVPLYAGNITSAANTVIERTLHRNASQNFCISATGAHGIVYAKKNPAFKKLLNNFYMNLPDGMPGVWVGRMKGAKQMRRCYGPDFFAEVMEASAGKRVRHFLCGGKEGVAGKLKEACRIKFGNENITGTFCPPFMDVSAYNYKEIAKKIDTAGADIVWVGISTPKQEQFARELSRFTSVQFLITVGAAFDFHIGNVSQAPAWIQKAGLEWLFRLIMEPRRLYKRYLEIVPKFFLYSIVDLFGYYRKTSRKQ